MNSKPKLKVNWCTHEAAKHACKRWHYSGTIPTSKQARLGIWEDDSFRGCLIFALGASPSLGSKYNLGIFECCELVRVALRDHHYPVSKYIAIALRIIRKKFPGLRMVVSFADTYHGHHGGIYQAGGWIYSGMSSKSKMVRTKDGDLHDVRRYSGHGFNKKKRFPYGAEIIEVPGKHRYLMPLDDEMRAKIEPLAKEYPKRAKQATG